MAAVLLLPRTMGTNGGKRKMRGDNDNSNSNTTMRDYVDGERKRKMRGDGGGRETK